MDVKDKNLLDREQSMETIKDIYMWENYPVLVLVKVSKE